MNGRRSAIVNAAEFPGNEETVPPTLILVYIGQAALGFVPLVELQQGEAANLARIEPTSGTEITTPEAIEDMAEEEPHPESERLKPHKLSDNGVLEQLAINRTSTGEAANIAVTKLLDHYQGRVRGIVGGFTRRS